jgi:hypothetical protein
MNGLDLPAMQFRVLERFEVGKVLHYDEMKLYRPECLRHHDVVGKYYSHK